MAISYFPKRQLTHILDLNLNQRGLSKSIDLGFYQVIELIHEHLVREEKLRIQEQFIKRNRSYIGDLYLVQERLRHKALGGLKPS